MTKDKKNMVTLDTHLKQWQDIAEQITTRLSSVIKIQSAIQKSIHPIFKAQENLQKALERLELIKIPRFDLSGLSRFAKQVADFQHAIQESINPAFKHLQRSFHELPPRTQEALLLLGEHGWYMDLEMPIPALWKLKEALSVGSIGDAEDALAEYFEARIKEIGESITKKFPHREHLIRAAFNAHHRKEYELAIPVFLSQTDGICKEVAGQYLFMRRDKKPCTAIYVEQIAADTFTSALLSPLTKVLPISASEHHRSTEFSALNRHMVMHGESLDYGTKINSLKAISLINYVAHVLTPEKER